MAQVVRNPTKDQAWVTSALNDEDAKKAIVLGLSLKETLTDKRTVVLMATDVTSDLKNALHDAFDFVFLLDEDIIKVHGRNDLTCEDIAKMSVLKLQSFGCCFYVSPQMMFVRNADDIFQLTSKTKLAMLQGDEGLSMFGVIPSFQAFNELVDYMLTKSSTGLQNGLLRILCAGKNAAIIKGSIVQHISLPGDITPNGLEDMAIVNFLSNPLEFRIENLGILETFVLTTWTEIYNKCEARFNQSFKIASPQIIPNMNSSKEPIAIVGMSCRFPGSNNLDEFWNILISGQDATSTAPPFRWTPEQSTRFTPECREINGGFLKEPVDEFDAKFFEISPKEMLFLDPQHRLLLELIWEGLENAGVDATKLKGTNGGVFMGSWTNYFDEVLVESGNDEFFRKYMGNSIGAAAARISFVLGLTGPSIATESGCSSSMVALHLACRSLQFGETNLALACGVNLFPKPVYFTELAQVLSPDGRCKTFDASANGYARAEGGGVLVLKRLSDAVKDGDSIWAVVRGSGVAQEGLSNSMGTPTVHSETLAMQLALADGQVSPELVSYVETHGTGTVTGDPIETEAIARAYHSDKRTEPLLIGSVKTNVGHTESCSGITGIIKVALALHHEQIPPHRNFTSLNPAIDLNAIPAKIPMEPMEWNRTPTYPRIAGVSSFGITGTDAHTIIQESPITNARKGFKLSLERPLHIMKLSAKTEQALDKILVKYENYLKTSEGVLWENIAHTANVGRADFAYRSVVIAKTKEDAIKSLGDIQGVASEPTDKKICFLFTGQGSQYTGMAKQLYGTSPVFRIYMDYCARLLRDMYGINILELMWTSEKQEELNKTLYSQTSIFCVEYALAKLWESWGVTPDYVLGHSLGEFTAAVCAGVISVEDSLKLVAERSRLINQLPTGKMLVIRANQNVVNSALLTFFEGDQSKMLEYAAINSDEQTVVAGDSNAILSFSTFLKEKLNLKCVVLQSSHAFHSKHMDPILGTYRDIAMSVSPAAGKCGYISGVRGKLLGNVADELDAEYWVDHTREPVQFIKASKKAIELGCRIFIEIGPQPVLTALTMMNTDVQLTCLPSLKRGEEDWDVLLGTLSKLYISGVNIDWQGFDKYYNREKVRLPHYPFTKKSFWPKVLANTDRKIHPLLGKHLPNPTSSKLFQAKFQLEELEYIKDHVVGENVIFPGAGFLEMSLAAGYYTSFDKDANHTVKIENLVIDAPFRLQSPNIYDIHLSVDPCTENDSNFTIKIFQAVSTQSQEKWIKHMQATFNPNQSSYNHQDLAMHLECFKSTISSDDLSVHTEDIYRTLATTGLYFGLAFQSLERFWRKDIENALVAKMKTAEEIGIRPETYLMHPVILDAMLQAIMFKTYFTVVEKGLKWELHLPVKISEFILFPKISPLTVETCDDIYIYVYNDVKRNCLSSLLLNSEGHVMAIMSGVEFVKTTVAALDAVLEQETRRMPTLWEESWRAQPSPMQARVRFNTFSLSDAFTPEFSELVNEKYNNLSKLSLETFQLLDEFTYYSMLNCLYDCGWEPRLNQMFKTEELLESLKIKQEHWKYVGYFLEVFAKEGILIQDMCADGTDRKWGIVCLPPSKSVVTARLSSPIFVEELVKRFPPTILFKRYGENLMDIIQGRQNALSILFTDSTSLIPSAHEYYQSYGELSNSLSMISSVVEQRLRHLEENTKDEKTIIRIIEIGGGTGIYTQAWIDALERVGIEYEYTFTDISPAFFPAAEKKFEKQRKNFIFKKLDIERDPLDQGFIPEYYDYVIASEAIHAQSDVKESLKNVRILVRSKGMVDIFELTKVNRLMSYLFGCLDGFGGFEGTMSKKQWVHVLQAAGFEVSQILSCRNDHHSLICCRKDKDRVGNPKNEEKRPSWLLFSDGSTFCDKLAYKLESSANRSVIKIRRDTANDSCPDYFVLNGKNKGDFERFISTVNGPVEGVLYCWALGEEHQSQSDILQPYLYIAQSLSLLQQKGPPRLIAITSGCIPVGEYDLNKFKSNTLWGFTKSLKNETPELHCYCINLEDYMLDTEDGLQALFYELWKEDTWETQVALGSDPGSIRYVPRLQPHKPVITEGLKLPSGTNRYQLALPESKSISDLKFGPLEQMTLEGHQVEVQVRASALNFKDVLTVLKPTDEFKKCSAVGFDFAGVVTKVGPLTTKWKLGDSVFGVNLAADGRPDSLPSHIIRHEDDVERLPDNMTFCEAATLPNVFATVYHSLIEVAKIQAKDTVLIHTGSGGVGLCAIQICQFIGCKIIATAGSKRKINYLRAACGIEHIFNSRNTSFCEEILKLTNGRGVDVVLNSLTSEGFKEATLKACAEGARFVEMSKVSIWTPEEIVAIRSDVKYTVVDVSAMPVQDIRRWNGKLIEFLQSNTVRPLSYIRFGGVCIKDALDYLQKAKHIGKVVCVMPEISKSGRKAVTSLFNDRSTYLITGGLGGIGFEVAKWMLNSGAKHILLAGRSKPKTSIQAEIDQLNSQGGHLIPVQLDVANREQLKSFLEDIKGPSWNMPPLRGVMHAAGMLSDSLVQNQDWTRFVLPLNAKVDGTLNLHELTQGYLLEHFVLFSSITALVGTPGQSNYAAANCFQDAMAHYRHSIGLPATTVNWGIWAEVGMATSVTLPGIRGFSTQQGLSALEYALKSHRVQTCVVNIDSTQSFINTYPQAVVYLDEKVREAEQKASYNKPVTDKDFWKTYDSKFNKEDKFEFVKGILENTLRKILKMDDSEMIEYDLDFQRMGLDSLMLVELRNILQSLFGDRLNITMSLLRELTNISLLSTEIFKNIEGLADYTLDETSKAPSFEDVKQLIRTDSQLPAHIKPNDDQPPAVEVENIATVLLTGANGSLGPYILRDLCAKPQIKKIFCLVRSRRNESGETRLIQELESKNLLLEVDMSKVECIDGDVALPNFGLTKEKWDYLANEVDAVFSIAAKVNYVEYYKQTASQSDIRTVNINGVNTVLELAVERRTKHVFHASSMITASKCDNHGRKSEEWPEIEDFDGVSIFAYPVSKFVGDLLMKQATKRGVPCKIFRFPLLTGESSTGQFSMDKNHFMLRYVHILKTGKIPTLPFPMFFLPVDLSSQVSIKMFFNPNYDSGICNIFHNDPDPDTEFIKIAKKFGCSIETEENSEFMRKIQSEPDSSPIGMLKEYYKDENVYMKLYNALFGSWAEGNKQVWISNKLSRIEPEFYPSLKRTVEYLEQDFVYAKSQGWFGKYGITTSAD